MKKIGLYFGTFNPIHIGHLIIANHIVEYSDLDEVWFVVTPHNPHKKKKTLLNDYHRYQMVEDAIESYPKLKASKIEFKLPQPNYTIHTLAHLSEKYPKDNFTLILGEDNLQSLPKWKNYEEIISNYKIIIYPRVYNGKEKSVLENHMSISKIDAPIMELSSTFIRKSIKEGKNYKPLVPPIVYEFIDKMNFYK